MPDLAGLIRSILAAPAGPQVAAFFDYDGTLISGYSASAFYQHRITSGQLGPDEFVRTVLHAARGIKTEDDFAAFLELSLRAWKGRPLTELQALSAKLFKHQIAGQLHPEVWRLVQAHRERGHTIVLASSATRFQVEPMAAEIGAAHLLCTELEVVDGLLTGRSTGFAMWASGKAAAVERLSTAEGYDLAAAFAYSNGHEDVAFLSLVGHPVCVQPDTGLRKVARTNGWPVLPCAPRGGLLPGATDIARTTAFYGSLAGAFGAGLGLGALNNSRETLLSITGGVGSDLALAVAGIDVEIAGTEHLWSARPCVFVFNHQSKIDTILLAKLLRGGFTGVAKKEAANVPGFGQFFRIAGVAFIDRADGAKAQAAMAPAVEKLRAGTSLVIAPEGTRSPTPRLGPFKKGAFHLAMQAEVPMVPIVIRNAGEVMWRGAQTVRPGRVQVAVLPPVVTSAWSRQTISAHVAEVRDRFVETLAHWPSEPIDRS